MPDYRYVAIDSQGRERKGRLTAANDDAARADELEAYAKKNLPPSVSTAVAKTADNIRFQAEFKARALPQIDAWWQARVRR